MTFVQLVNETERSTNVHFSASIEIGDFKIEVSPREQPGPVSQRPLILKNLRGDKAKRHHILRRRAAAIAVYGGRCVECGATENLEFDHVKNDGAAHRDAESINVMLARIASSGQPIEDYELQLLCRPHHEVKTRQERNPGMPANPNGITRQDVADALEVLCQERGGAVRLAQVADLLEPPGLDRAAQLRHDDLIRGYLVDLALNEETGVVRPAWGQYEYRPAA